MKIKEMKLLRELPSPALGIKRCIDLTTNPCAKAWIWQVLLDDGREVTSKITDAKETADAAFVELGYFLFERWKILGEETRLTKKQVSRSEYIIEAEASNK